MVQGPADLHPDPVLGSIPRVLHWIWLGPNPIPVQHQEWMRTWKHHHPAWETRVWAESDVLPLHNMDAYNAARSWAQKADIARYEILLRHGGVYVDTDMECQRPLTPLLEGVEAFVGLERDDLMGNAILGCTPGHPWMAAVVDALADSFHAAWLTMEQTGPSFLTRVTDGRDDVVVHPAEVFYPRPSTDLDHAVPISPEAFAIHHWGKSWAASEVQMMQEAAQEVIGRALPAGTTCVCVDAGLVISWADGRRGVPLVERDGEDHGPPADDAHALEEVDRQRHNGIEWFVFLAPAFWWLDHYAGLAGFLREKAQHVVEEPSLVAFRLPPA